MGVGCLSPSHWESSALANWESFPKPCVQTPSEKQSERKHYHQEGGVWHRWRMGDGGWGCLLWPLPQLRPPGSNPVALCWCYLQGEVRGGEGHLGEADGPLDVMVAPEDGNTRGQARLERRRPWGTTGTEAERQRSEMHLQFGPRVLTTLGQGCEQQRPRLPPPDSCLHGLPQQNPWRATSTRSPHGTRRHRNPA